MLSIQVLFIPFLALKRNLAKDNLFLSAGASVLLHSVYFDKCFRVFSNQWNDDINMLIASENLSHYLTQVDKRAILNKSSF